MSRYGFHSDSVEWNDIKDDGMKALLFYKHPVPLVTCRATQLAKSSELAVEIKVADLRHLRGYCFWQRWLF